MDGKDTDDEWLGRAHKTDNTSSSEEEQEEEEESDESDDEESEEEGVEPSGGPCATTEERRPGRIADLHTRHPWFKKWLKDGRNAADLLPEQYPKGYDPKRNESKLECFNRTGEEERSAKGC